MSYKNEKQLLRNIEINLSNRPDNFYHSKPRFRFLILSMIITVSLIIIFTITRSIEFFFEEGFNQELIGFVLSVCAFLALDYYLYIMYLKAPKDQLKKDRWLWKMGKRLAIAQIIYPILLIISIVYNFNPYTQESEFSKKIFTLLIISFLFFIAYGFSILIALINPKKILSKWTNIIGTSGFILQFIPVGFILIDFYQKNYIRLFFLIFLLFWLLFLTVGHSINLIRKQNLSILQIHSLNIISPFKVFEVISTEDQNLKNRIRALKFIKKKYEKNEIAYLSALNAELIKEKNSQTKFPFIKHVLTILGIFTTLILFFLEAIGEGMIQELFLNRIKEFLCDLFNRTC